MTIKTIYVFLNRKLISADTIAPFLIETKEANPEISFILLVPDPETLRVIERNEVIFDALKSVGEFRSLSLERPGVFRKTAKRLGRWLSYLGIAIQMMLGRARIIHFKALNFWPMRLLYFVKPSAVYLFQAAEVALTPLELEAQIIMQADNPKWLDGSAAKMFKANKNSGGAVIGFDPNWPAFTDDSVKSKPKHLISMPYKRPRWKQYLKTNRQKYFLKSGVSDEDNMVVFILSSMPPLNSQKDPNDDGTIIFEETLALLSKYHSELTIIVKPHPATEAQTFARIKEIVALSGLPNIHIANIHPTILATRALFFIANNFSTTFTVACAFGVPTIEYTEYDDETFALTGGKSTNPPLVTHFIQRQPDLLVQTITDIRNSSTPELETSLPYDVEYLEVIRKLTQ